MTGRIRNASAIKVAHIPVTKGTCRPPIWQSTFWLYVVSHKEMQRFLADATQTARWHGIMSMQIF